MSRRLLVSEGQGCYHVVSRVVDRRFVFGEEERARFRGLMEELLGFSGVECLTYCLMSNHFHLLLAVPDGEERRAEMGDGEFFGRLGCIYSEEVVEEVRQRLEELHRESPPQAEAYRERYLRRMFSLPVFVQELKRRFSQWYNRRSERCGTLWEERYRSVLVEDGRALAAVAGYIDLNPVRAGLVKRAGKDRWSGYGEALRGGERARAGLARVLDPVGGEREWKEVASAYGGMLAIGSDPWRGANLAGGDIARASKGSRQSVGQLRALTKGLAVGSHQFLERLFEEHRGWFGQGRHSGSRKIRGTANPPGTWDGIRCLRDLRSL